jgi:hypothetical protein
MILLCSQSSCLDKYKKYFGIKASGYAWPAPPIPPVEEMPSDESEDELMDLPDESRTDVYTLKDIRGDFGRRMSSLGYNPLQFIGWKKGPVFTGCG